VRSCTERGRAGGDKRSAFPAYQHFHGRSVVQAISELAELRFHVDVDRFVPRRIQSVVHVRQDAGIAGVVAHLGPIGVITG
jgi:hypothetical protein